MKSQISDGMSFMVVERTDTDAWAAFPELIRRVSDFCVKYDSDADVGLLCNTLMQAFILPKPGLIGMLFFDASGKCVGHLLIQLEVWMGCPIATIIQVEFDVFLSEGIFPGALDWLERWAIASGAKWFQCIARNEAVSRLFRMKFDFKTKGVIMRRGLISDAVDGDRVPVAAAATAEAN